MKPILPLLGLAAAGLVWAFSKEEEAQAAPKPQPRPGQPQPGGSSPIPGVPSIPSPPTAGQEPQVPPNVLARMVAALATGNSKEIRRVALELEKEGFPRQASELRAAADALDASAGVVLPQPIVVPRPPPNAVPVPPPVAKPQPVIPPFVPPGLITVDNPIARPPSLPTRPLPPAKPSPAPPIVVPVPPPNAVPVAPPKQPFPVGAIPDQATLVGKTALMLWESAPGPVRDVALLTTYKKSVGLKDPGNLYGAGTAKSFMMREIVPPTPWDWPASASSRKKLAKDLRDNYLFKARKDPARSEEWKRAAADLAPFLK